MPKVNTPVAFVTFTKAKAIVARPMSATDSALFERGEELGFEAVGFELELTSALKSLKTREERIILRAGFASSYSNAKRVPLKVAQKHFDYLASKFAATSTSRKAKHIAKKTGRKEKIAAKVDKLSEKTVAARLVAMLAFIADWQQDANDEDTIERLGKLAKMANGTK